MEWISSVPIAHRGLHSGDATCPENSLPAFEAACRGGCPIELDVRLTADGEVVVLHDADLERVTGVAASVASCSLAGIRRLRLLGTSHGVPTLRDVLDLVDGAVPLLVEIKHQRLLSELCAATFECLRGYRGCFAVQSFNPFAMRWFADNAPSIRRGQIAGDFRGEQLALFKKLVLGRLWLSFVSRPHFIAHDHRALPHPVVARERRRGTPVLAWTIRSEENAREALEHSDNYIFEGFRPS